MDLTNKMLLVIGNVSDQREEARTRCVRLAQMIGFLYLASLAEGTVGMQICGAATLAAAIFSCVRSSSDVRQAHR